ncbi:MAG: DUF2891 domain-containing protein [Bacteroidales bacterium]|nr:DUF2891 domain-containing protein [Candidatus Latescibacterota bacterium]
MGRMRYPGLIPGSARRVIWLFLAFILFAVIPGAGVSGGILSGGLSRDAASSFARVALACVNREFPNKDGHVAYNDDEVIAPTGLHPSFYGCFDWHSSVHGHWLLARVLNRYPDLPEAPEIRDVLIRNLTAKNIEVEAAYFMDERRVSFERTYGWAWLLKLAEELGQSNDSKLLELHGTIEPLVSAIRDRYMEFLPRQEYPIRRGVHPNTAFGIAFALDYARSVSDAELGELLLRKASDYFFLDTGCPGAWEPDGDDFFSPCLMEADLMRRVLDQQEFAVWLDRFLPGLSSGRPESLLLPAEVSDRTDPKIVHLDGLNLSRAWCMLGIAKALPVGHPAGPVLRKSAELHAGATLGHIASGNYEGEHWLASFAVYMLSETGR